MTQLSLAKTRIHAGIWEGLVTAGDDQSPEIEILHLGQPVKSFDLGPVPGQPGTWVLKIAIPPDLLSDGVQTFVVRDAATEATLHSFAVVTGEPLEDDLRAEIDLLRAELDMLKRAFRRHCLETE